MGEDGVTGPVMPVTVLPVLGLPEVVAGDDVAGLVLEALGPSGLEVGDVVVVSSKLVSKALGLRASGGSKDALVLEESVRVVAERRTADGMTRVVEAAAGPVMAAAGIDGSNTGPGEDLLLLPHDPDSCARELRSSLRDRFGMPSTAPLAVVLSDTAGRPWRAGLTDFALGSAGLRVLLDHRGESDVDGRRLAVTARAVADEIAAAADLVKGKADGVGAAVVRGLPSSWFEDEIGSAATVSDAAVADPAVVDHTVFDAAVSGAEPSGSGAAQLVRTGPGDWFAMGHVEAVRAALGVQPGSPESEQVGIRAVGLETFGEVVSRVVAVTLLHDEDASVDLQVIEGGESSTQGTASAEVTMGAGDDFALGRLAQRLEVAAAGEGLSVSLGAGPTAGHTVSARLVPGG
ncbi:coenzyme F420-0:L-glutamate ligase [Knoellia sp. CPCC 206450]|uniref:coenzyme F420-0:L-glutamate ligase n=1 Tax=Knoellia tibetensis TaxID=3404798 RepID=UPI003B436A3D